MESQYASQLLNILLLKDDPYPMLVPNGSWDYWEVEKMLSQGKGPIAKLPTIPRQFASPEEYMRVFEPLLLEECAAQLTRGQEEEGAATAHAAVVAQCEERADGSQLVRLTMPPGISAGFSENDIILLSADNPEEEEGPNPTAHALGCIEGREGEQSVRARFRLTDASQAGNPKGEARARLMRSAIARSGSAWWVLKLANTSTILREWAAVHCVAHMSLREVLLTAKPTQALAGGALMVPPRMEANMRQTYNASQMAAVTAGLQGSQVVLIQGPPGTGKTKTILGLLSIVMHSAPKGAFASAGSGIAAAAAARVDGGSGSPGAKHGGAWNSHMLWLAGSPWLAGRPNPRDTVVPADLADSSDAFGLLKRTIPRRIGKGSGPKARILVCAPSNSALDEIVLRLISSGLTDQDGHVFTPNVVRVGVNIHHSVLSVALDTLVDHRLGAESGAQTGSMTRFERDRMRMAILEEANIVCTTLAFSGSGLFLRLTRKFDVVVIDEAAQAVEPSTLVPLAHGAAKQVYLVGDPVQLPATVMSQRALGVGYDASLFKRLQSAGYPVQMLDTQYRMHPKIREFPSLNFYGGNLKDGPDMDKVTARPWHTCPAFQPLMFYDVRSKESVPPGSASLVNAREAEVVLSVYRELVHRHPTLRTSPAVGVISPYKAQVTLLRDLFKKALGPEGARMVDINTIDGFQGREKDICIFSTVRSKKGRSIGFVADERRINVGLTRARSALILIGNGEALQQDNRWAALISHARKLGCMYRVEKPYTEFASQVADGKVRAEAPTPEDLAEFVPQPEVNHLAEEEDYLYSDDEGVVHHLAALPSKTQQAKRCHAAADAAITAADRGGKRTKVA